MNHLSLKQSNEIFKLVNDFLIHSDLDRFFISKSELNGYNSIDISNGYKLQVAIKYFFNSEENEDIRSFSELCDSSIVNFLARVIPDEVHNELKVYDKQDIEYKVKLSEIRKIVANRTALIEEFESCVSFLEFCEGLGRFTKSSQIYNNWENVYSHLNLIFDHDEFKEFTDEFIKSLV